MQYTAGVNGFQADIKYEGVATEAPAKAPKWTARQKSAKESRHSRRVTESAAAAAAAEEERDEMLAVSSGTFQASRDQRPAPKSDKSDAKKSAKGRAKATPASQPSESESESESSLFPNFQQAKSIGRNEPNGQTKAAGRRQPQESAEDFGLADDRTADAVPNSPLPPKGQEDARDDEEVFAASSLPSFQEIRSKTKSRDQQRTVQDDADVPTKRAKTSSRPKQQQQQQRGENANSSRPHSKKLSWDIFRKPVREDEQ